MEIDKKSFHGPFPQLEYYDRNGKQISQAKWKELTLTSGYQLVKFGPAKQENINIKTSWCGVKTIIETKKLLFITEVFTEKDKGKDKETKEIESRRKWSETEQEALKEHVLAIEATYELPVEEKPVVVKKKKE